MEETGPIELDSVEEKREEVSEREIILQKTVFKLQKRKRKAKEKVKVERMKVRTLEQEVERLRVRLMYFETREQEEEEVWVKVRSQEDKRRNKLNIIEEKNHEQENGDVTVEETEKGAELNNEDNIVVENSGEESLDNHKRVMEAQKKQLKFNLNTVMVTTERKRGVMKFLHLSSEVQGRVVRKGGKQALMLKQHINVEYPVICSECGRRFARRSTLTCHKKSVHALEHPCQQPGCKETFNNKRNAKRHMQVVHLKQKGAVKCQEQDCEKVFRHREMLEDHMRRIHGEPWLLCQVEGCHREFQTTRALKEHMKTSHQVQEVL